MSKVSVEVEVGEVTCAKCGRTEPLRPTALKRARDGSLSAAAVERPAGWLAWPIDSTSTQEGLCPSCSASWRAAAEAFVDDDEAPSSPPAEQRLTLEEQARLDEADRILREKQRAVPIGTKYEPSKVQSSPIVAPSSVVQPAPSMIVHRHVAAAAITMPTNIPRIVSGPPTMRPIATPAGQSVVVRAPAVAAQSATVAPSPRAAEVAILGPTRTSHDAQPGKVDPVAAPAARAVVGDTSQPAAPRQAAPVASPASSTRATAAPSAQPGMRTTVNAVTNAPAASSVVVRQASVPAHTQQVRAQPLLPTVRPSSVPPALAGAALAGGGVQTQFQPVGGDGLGGNPLSDATPFPAGFAPGPGRAKVPAPAAAPIKQGPVDE